jgi:hypothetical protein
VENKLLRDIHESVVAGFVDGKPPHHHPSARCPRFDLGSPPASCIFVVEYTDFVKKSQFEIQEIFGTRHIMVVNAPLEDEGFSLETLANYANVHRTVDIIGQSLKLFAPQ